MHVWHNKNVPSEVRKSIEINSLEKQTMIKASSIDTTTVTPEQIGACYKVFVASIPFYKVQSESDPFKQYTVSWSREHGFSCTCKSGQVAFSNTRDGYCKHVRWSVAASREERQALAELQAAICAPQAPVTVTNVDLETRARVAAASERASVKPVSKAKGRTSGFSLMR